MKNGPPKREHLLIYIGAVVVLGFGALLLKPANPIAKIARLQANLLAADHAIEGPTCGSTDLDTCLSVDSAYFGSKVPFSHMAPNQADVATVAFELARGAHAANIGNADAWISALRSGVGSGTDALRIALAMRLQKLASDLKATQYVEDERIARVLLARISNDLPGACRTYEKLGAGETLATPELDPNTSVCVGRDLKRTLGPGSSYGEGFWRAAKGAEVLLREYARAEREGLSKMANPASKARVEQLLAGVDPFLHELEIKQVATPLGETHHSAPPSTPLDAGVRTSESLDAGSGKLR